MVGEQKLTLSQQRKRRDIQMVGMAVREPMVLRIPDSLDLKRGDLIIVRPTAEICIRVDPGIRREDRLVIVGNHDCIARGFEEAHLRLLFPMGRNKGEGKSPDPPHSVYEGLKDYSARLTSTEPMRGNRGFDQTAQPSRVDRNQSTIARDGSAM